MSRGGYVKVDRKMLESDLIHEPVTFTVFMYLLLSANYRDGEYSGQQVARGEAVTSYSSISEAIGITERQARYALAKLTKSGRVTIRRYSKFSVVTILNYDKHQSGTKKKSFSCQQNVSQFVSQFVSRENLEKPLCNSVSDVGNLNIVSQNVSQFVSNLSPSKEIKNINNINNYSSCSNYIEEFAKSSDDGSDDDEREDTRLYCFGKGRKVMLSEPQVEKLLQVLSLDEFNFYLDKLDRFITEKNASVKNHYETILKWAREDRAI